MEYQGALILQEIGIKPDLHDENKGFISGPSSELLARDSDQYFKKFKQSSEVQYLPKPEKIKFSLKDEIALAGMESKQQQHHILFSS